MATRLEMVQEQMIERIRGQRTPLGLSLMLYADYGLEPFGNRLSDHLQLKPLLAIVEVKSDRRQYYKQFNPLTGHEAHDEFVFASNLGARLGQFERQELAMIDHMFRIVDGRTRDRQWRYLRLVQPGELTQ